MNKGYKSGGGEFLLHRLFLLPWKSRLVYIPYIGMKKKDDIITKKKQQEGKDERTSSCSTARILP